MIKASHNRIISIGELWQFFNRSASLFCISGPDGYLLHVNPYVVKILGFTEEQLLATPYEYFIHEGDREYSSRQSAKVRNEIETIHFCNRILTRSSGHRLISWTATYIPDEDNVYLIGQTSTKTQL